MGPFSFGVIGDVQYRRSDPAGPRKDATDPNREIGYSRNGPRDQLVEEWHTRWFHRALYVVTKRALDELRKRGVARTVFMGDILDSTAAARGDSPSLVADSLADFQALLGEYPENAFNYNFVFGNNDAKTIGREGWLEHFIPSTAKDKAAVPCSLERLFFDFSPSAGVRFVILDAYDESITVPPGGELSGSASSHEAFERAKAYLGEGHPQALQQFLADGRVDWDYVLDLALKEPDTPERRQKLALLPYNGRVGSRQLAWLRSILEAATEQRELVFVFSHLAVSDRVVRPDGIMWNADEVKALLHQFPCVVAIFAGHDHNGGFATDEMGLHHIVPPAPLESTSDDAFGVVTVHDDCFLFDWVGNAPPTTHGVFPGPLQTLRFRR